MEKKLTKAQTSEVIRLSGIALQAQNQVTSFVNYLKKELDVDDDWQLKPDATAFIRPEVAKEKAELDRKR